MTCHWMRACMPTQVLPVASPPFSNSLVSFSVAIRYHCFLYHCCYSCVLLVSGCYRIPRRLYFMQTLRAAPGAWVLGLCISGARVSQSRQEQTQPVVTNSHAQFTKPILALRQAWLEFSSVRCGGIRRYLHRHNRSQAAQSANAHVVLAGTHPTHDHLQLATEQSGSDSRAWSVVMLMLQRRKTVWLPSPPAFTVVVQPGTASSVDSFTRTTILDPIIAPRKKRGLFFLWCLPRRWEL